MCNRGFCKVLVLEPQHWFGWLMGHEECCLETCFYFLIPTLPLKISCEEWREQIPGTIWTFWEWMVCAPSWDHGHLSFLSLVMKCCQVLMYSPYKLELLSGLWILLAFGAMVAASSYYFSALAEHFRCIPIILCTWYHSIHFCSALSSSSLWIKHPYWSCRYVGCFQAEVLFSENSVPLE